MTVPAAVNVHQNAQASKSSCYFLFVKTDILKKKLKIKIMLKKYKYRSKTRFPIISFHHNIPLYSSLSFQVLLYFNITTRCTGSNLEWQNQHKSTNCETFSSWWTVYIHTFIITISKIDNVDPLFSFIMSFLIGFCYKKKNHLN